MEGLHKTKHFVLGCDNLFVATDHKPLLGVFNKPLEDIENPRLLSLVEKTLWFKFTPIHVPGRWNSGPDYMSRQRGITSDTKEARINMIMAMASTGNMDSSPAGYPQAIDRGLMERSLIAAVTGALAYGEETRAITLDRVKAAIHSDEKLSALREALNNTSHQLRLPEDLEEFDRYRDRL